MVFFYTLAALVFGLYLRSSRSLPKIKIARLERRLFKDIMGVGALAAIGAVQADLIVTRITAAVGGFGADAIAGYGIASRLDYLQIPVIFGLGATLEELSGVTALGPSVRKSLGPETIWK